MIKSFLPKLNAWKLTYLRNMQINVFKTDKASKHFVWHKAVENGGTEIVGIVMQKHLSTNDAFFFMSMKNVLWSKITLDMDSKCCLYFHFQQENKLGKRFAGITRSTEIVWAPSGV